MKEKESITISIESDLKKIAEEIFEQFGMTKNEAIELFYRQVALTKKIPFVQRNMNQETIQTMQELKSKENLTTYDKFADLRQDLGVLSKSPFDKGDLGG